MGGRHYEPSCLKQPTSATLTNCNALDSGAGTGVAAVTELRTLAADCPITRRATCTALGCRAEGPNTRRKCCSVDATTAYAMAGSISDKLTESAKYTALHTHAVAGVDACNAAGGGAITNGTTRECNADKKYRVSINTVCSGVDASSLSTTWDGGAITGNPTTRPWRPG